MVFSQLERRLEWDQDTMAGHFLNELPNDGILLSKNLPGVVVAHCVAVVVAARRGCRDGVVDGNEVGNESGWGRLLAGTRCRWMGGRETTKRIDSGFVGTISIAVS